MVLRYVISAVVAYFIGNFSSALFYSKIFAHEDVRTKGSGNAGAANMLRSYGLKMGLATFFTDFLKGALAIIIGRLIGGEQYGTVCGYIAGIAVLIGHNWPVLYGFKGGKGVSASIGVIFMIHPLMTFIIFVISVSLIFITGYVSVASVFGLGIAPFVIAALNWGDWKLIIAVTIISAIVVISHRGNIKRLLRGEEKKVSFRKK